MSIVAGGAGVGGPLAEWYVYISCLSTAYKTKGWFLGIEGNR